MKSTFRILLGFAAMVVGFSMVTPAYAAVPWLEGLYTYSCTNPTYGVNGTYATYVYTGRNGNTGSYSHGFCSDTGAQSGTVVTDSLILRAAVGLTSNMIANRIAAVTSGQGQSFAMNANGFNGSSGVSAGNGDMVGVWVSGAFSSLEDDSVSTAFDGDYFNVMAGMDYQMTNEFLVGLAVSYEDHDYDTTFNGGTLEADGFTVAPYISMALDDMYSVSVTGGYSDIDYDSFRLDPGGIGVTASGSTSSDRYFVEGRINAYYPVDMWRIRGSLGLLYANEEKDAFTETLSDGTTNDVAANETDFAQLRLNTEWGYEVAPGFIPYLRAGVEFDIEKDDVDPGTGPEPSVNGEDFGGVFGLGARFALDNAVSAGIEATTVEFRDDYEEYTVQGNLRLEF